MKDHIGKKIAMYQKEITALEIHNAALRLENKALARQISAYKKQWRSYRVKALSVISKLDEIEPPEEVVKWQVI